MSLPHDLTFRYENDDFSLVRVADSSHPITINGLAYDVKGSKDKLEEVYQLLRSASLDSVVSEADLKTKLSSVKGISIPSAKATQEIGKKHVAKTTDDIKEQRPIRPRALSTVATDRLTEKQEIEKKSGEMWECVGRKPDPGSNGYLYTFKLREEFDYTIPTPDAANKRIASDKKMAEIYPAIEPQLEDVLQFDPKITKEDYVKSILEVSREAIEERTKLCLQLVSPGARKPEYENYLRNTITNEMALYAGQNYARLLFLRELGYKSEQKKDGLYLTLPDKETLIARWEKFREKNPQLPRFDIASSEGIASDMAYIEAHLQHDVLLSEGKEFVHDHLSHITPTLSLIVDIFSSVDPKDAKSRWEFIKVILNTYQKLAMVQQAFEGKSPSDPIMLGTKLLRENLDKLALGLSYFVDLVSSIPTLPLLKNRATFSNLESIYHGLSTNTAMSHYLTNRFGPANEAIERIDELWDQMETLVKYIRMQQKRSKMDPTQDGS